MSPQYGSGGGYYSPQQRVNSETVEQIRLVLSSLEVGDRVEYEIRTQHNAATDTVVSGIEHYPDGNGIRLEITLVGPQGGEYYFTDHPFDECPHAMSPTGSQGPLLELKKSGR